MDVKVHLIFNPKDNEDNGLVDPFKEYEILVDYDEDFSSAIKRLEDPENIKPDYIIASELAAAAYKNKLETLAKQLTLLRQYAPGAKITFLMENDPEEVFEVSMKDIGIDIVLGQEYMFDIDELLRLKEEKSKADKEPVKVKSTTGEKSELIPEALAKLEEKAAKEKKEPAAVRKKIKKVLHYEKQTENGYKRVNILHL